MKDLDKLVKEINFKCDDGTEVKLHFTKYEFEGIIKFHEKMIVMMGAYEQDTNSDSNIKFHQESIKYISHIQKSMFEEGK